MFGMELLLGPCATTVLIGITSIILIYWYSTRNYNYWKKRGVPYSKPLPFIGSVWENFFKPHCQVEYEKYFKYGPVYGHFEGSRPLLSVGDPELLRNIFVKDFQYFPQRRSITTGDTISDNMVSTLEGEDWKRVRNIITPTFSTGKIKRMMGIYKECARTLLINFKQEVHKGKPLNCKAIYGAFVMDVIASSAFSTKLDSHNDPKNKFVQIAKNVFSTDFSVRLAFFQLIPGFMKKLGVSVISPSATQFFKDVTLQIIEERKKTGQTRNDFLQLLMDTAKDAAKEEADVVEREDLTANYAGDEGNQHVFKNASTKKLSIDELVAQCVIFFLAGYDTIGTTLTLLTYELAMNQDVQEKLYEEIQEILQETKGILTYEAIQDMKYLDNVISETMRLYPAVVRLERTVERDYKLPNTDITVPKGMLISIPVYAFQRDPKHFPDPEKFDPDRFLPEEKAKRHPYAYVPFGSGPRNCIGMRFALVEMKVCLAYVLTNFRVKRCPQTMVPLEFDKGVGLLQPKDILLEFEQRETSPLDYRRRLSSKGILNFGR